MYVSERAGRIKEMGLMFKRFSAIIFSPVVMAFLISGFTFYILNFSATGMD